LKKERKAYAEVTENTEVTEKKKRRKEKRTEEKRGGHA
jgi:hypothetical protein